MPTFTGGEKNPMSRVKTDNVFFFLLGVSVSSLNMRKGKKQNSVPSLSSKEKKTASLQATKCLQGITVAVGNKTIVESCVRKVQQKKVHPRRSYKQALKTVPSVLLVNGIEKVDEIKKTAQIKRKISQFGPSAEASAALQQKKENFMILNPKAKPFVPHKEKGISFGNGFEFDICYGSERKVEKKTGHNYRHLTADIILESRRTGLKTKLYKKIEEKKQEAKPQFYVRKIKMVRVPRRPFCALVEKPKPKLIVQEKPSPSETKNEIISSKLHPQPFKLGYNPCEFASDDEDDLCVNIRGQFFDYSYDYLLSEDLLADWARGGHTTPSQKKSIKLLAAVDQDFAEKLCEVGYYTK